MGQLKERQRQSAPTSMGTSIVIMMIALVLSKITGQLREILAANRFGFAALNDAFIQGFLIPDFVYEILIGGSIQAALVPTLSGALGSKEEDSTWRSVSIFISFMSLLMLAVLIVCEIFAPQLMAIFARTDNHELVTKVARTLFPQTFFMMLAALCIGVLNSYRQFTRTAFGPVLYNCFVVTSLLLFAKATPAAVQRVAVGIVFGAFAYFLFQAFLGRRELRNFSFSLDFKDSGFRRLLWLSLPTLLASSIPQLNNIILNSFMKSFPKGAPTALRSATTLWMLPWGVFAVAIGNVLLPSLSQSVARDNKSETANLLSESLRRALFLTIPCAIIFLFMRYDIVRGVYQWNVDMFNDEAVFTTGNMLFWFCFTIVTHTFVTIMNQAYFAVKKTFMPLINSVISLCMTAGFGYLFSHKTALGISGLSLGYALGSLIGAAFMFLSFRKMHPELARFNLLPFLGKVVLGILGIVAVLLPLRLMIGYWVPTGKWLQLLWLFFWSLLAILAYGAIAYLLDIDEIKQMIGPLTKFFQRMRKD
ncbi:MAG TPA: murein biosynthesis integral membrane protein MurJ [Clostridiaceae bacterium]|nr:murein biosynthesis integral membrane protein MurJ [Clostridiaceae bacterium]